MLVSRRNKNWILSSTWWNGSCVYTLEHCRGLRCSGFGTSSFAKVNAPLQYFIPVLHILFNVRSQSPISRCLGYVEVLVQQGERHKTVPHHVRNRWCSPSPSAGYHGWKFPHPTGKLSLALDRISIGCTIVFMLQILRLPINEDDMERAHSKVVEKRKAAQRNAQ